MGFNKQAYFLPVFKSLIRNVTNKMHSLSSQIWKDIFFVPVVEKAARKWTGKPISPEAVGKSGIPLDSVIMSEKIQGLSPTYHFTAELAGYSNLSLFLMESNPDLIRPILPLKSSYTLLGHISMLSDDKLIHFHRDLPHLKIQHIKHQTYLLDEHVKEMNNGGGGGGKEALIGLNKLLISRLKLGRQTFK